MLQYSWHNAFNSGTVWFTFNLFSCSFQQEWDITLTWKDLEQFWTPIKHDDLRDLQIFCKFFFVLVVFSFVNVDAHCGCCTTSQSSCRFPWRESFPNSLLGCITSSVPQVWDLSLGLLPENVMPICIQPIHFSVHTSCPLLSGTSARIVA